MTRYFAVVCAVCCCAAAAAAAPAQDNDDAFEFFAQEAKVVSASPIPATRQKSPATVYVVTAQDIKDSGAQNIWDALRGLPGVDVVQTKANQGEVSIRGLDQPNNTRTMVLLNGRKILNPFNDWVTWAAVPVSLQEIDRIEVVQGPASSVYGANAVNGAINIITKTPDKMQGSLLGYSMGERGARLVSYDYGASAGRWSWRLGGAAERIGSFERAGRNSSRLGKLGLEAVYAPDPDRELNLSGGFTGNRTEVSAAESIGDYFDQGKNGFAEARYRSGDTRYRAHWAHYSTKFDEFSAICGSLLASDEYFGEVSRTLYLPYDNQAVLSANYRRAATRSDLLLAGVKSDSWAGTLEDKWQLSDNWLLQAGARLDKQPNIDTMLSSRGSLIYSPGEDRSLRLSGGTAFRAPTLMHNYLDTDVTVPNPPSSGVPGAFSRLIIHTNGNRDLDPEKIRTVELAYTRAVAQGEFSLTGFYYQLKDMITPELPQATDITTPPDAYLSTRYHNAGWVKAWGGELALSARLAPWLSSYANYSLQLLNQQNTNRESRQSPRNKVNAGLRAKRHGWTWDLHGSWVDKTDWVATTDYTVMHTVPSYLLLNARAGYAFNGGLAGLEAGLSVFNLLNDEHYETLARLSATELGQSGELIRQRWTASLSYRF